MCVDNVLEHPFVFDLIKSETLDWELYDHIHLQNVNKESDPSLGFFSGYLSDFIDRCSKLSNMRNSGEIVFLPGRMNQEFLRRL